MFDLHLILPNSRFWIFKRLSVEAMYSRNNKTCSVSLWNNHFQTDRNSDRKFFTHFQDFPFSMQPLKIAMAYLKESFSLAVCYCDLIYFRLTQMWLAVVHFGQAFSSCFCWKSGSKQTSDLQRETTKVNIETIRIFKLIIKPFLCQILQSIQHNNKCKNGLQKQ